MVGKVETHIVISSLSEGSRIDDVIIGNLFGLFII